MLSHYKTYAIETRLAGLMVVANVWARSGATIHTTQPHDEERDAVAEARAWIDGKMEAEIVAKGAAK